MRDEYIYLDWNVIKYIKESDTDRKLIQCIDWLKYRYKFPFSFAQLCDRQRGDAQYIQEDLHFLNELSEGFMVGIDNESNSYDISHQNIFKKYNMVKDSKETTYPNIHINPETRKNILEKGFENYFSNSENAPQLFHVLMSALNRFDSDPELYTQFREFMIKKGEDLICTNGFIGIITDKNFSPADASLLLEEFQKFNDGKPLTQGQNMINLYMLLDFKRNYNGIRIYDKINRKNNFTNIYTDALHMNTAKYAKCYVTNDEITKRKTEFVYQSFGIETKVVTPTTFIEKIAREL